MGNENFVVIWDPEGQYWDGALISDKTYVATSVRGLVALPVDTSLFQLNGVGGYSKRAWGSGWPLDSATPRYFCKMAVYATHEHTKVHWAARVYATETVRKALADGTYKHASMVRLAGDAEQRCTTTAHLGQEETPYMFRELPPLDGRGGWTLAGSAPFSPTNDGYYAFSLYGLAPGFRVAWAAVSVTKG